MTPGICISLGLSIISLILNIIVFIISDKSHKRAKASLEKAKAENKACEEVLRASEDLIDNTKPELSIYLTTDYTNNHWFD